MPDGPNGLASMTQARERRARRTMPPPRHPVPTSSAETGVVEPAVDDLGNETPAGSAPVEQVNPLQHTELGAAAADPDEEPPSGKLTATSDNAPAGEPGRQARPATLYLEEAHVDFLEETRMAGLISRPRLDISKSAVVRLALRRLQQEMTIDEIRDYLKAQPVDSTKTGRKRR